MTRESRRCCPAFRSSTPLEVVRRSELVVIAVPHDQLDGLVTRSRRDRSLAAGAARAAHRSRRSAPTSWPPPVREGCHPARRASRDRVHRHLDRPPPAGERVRRGHGSRDRCCRSRRPSRSSSAASPSSSPRRTGPRTPKAIATATEFSRSIVRPGGGAAASGRGAQPGRVPVGARALHDRPCARRRGVRLAGPAPRYDQRMISTIDGLRTRLAEARAAAPDGRQDRAHLDDRRPPRRPHRPRPSRPGGRRHRRGLGLRESAPVRELRRVRGVSANARRGRAAPRVARRRRVFAPTTDELLPNGSNTTKVTAGDLGLRYEGRSRPFYFDGLLTVEAKLFNLVKPDVAVYGERDRQRIFLVERMIRDLYFDVDGRDDRDGARRRRAAGVDARRDARGARSRRRREASGGAGCRRLQRRPWCRRLHRRGTVVAHGRAAHPAGVPQRRRPGILPAGRRRPPRTGASRSSPQRSPAIGSSTTPRSTSAEAGGGDAHHSDRRTDRRSIEWEGWRILTDPTFDRARPHVFVRARHELVARPPGRRSRSTRSGDVDVVLLSHHQHADNLDDAGRRPSTTASTVVTTVAGAKALAHGDARGLAAGAIDAGSIDAGRPTLTVTATPCRHGPPLTRPIVGPATGFALTLEGADRPGLWMTGDTVLYRGAAPSRRGPRARRRGRAHRCGEVPADGSRSRTRWMPQPPSRSSNSRRPRSSSPCTSRAGATSPSRRRRRQRVFAAAPAEVRDRIRWLPLGEPVDVC